MTITSRINIAITIDLISAVIFSCITIITSVVFHIIMASILISSVIILITNIIATFPASQSALPSQDSYGDTALHDAIGKDSIEILELLGNSPHLDLNLRNKRGFNVLHHAALKGNNLWVLGERIFNIFFCKRRRLEE